MIHQAEFLLNVVRPAASTAPIRRPGTAALLRVRRHEALR
jgi:hypothetical protein